MTATNMCKNFVVKWYSLSNVNMLGSEVGQHWLSVSRIVSG